MRCWFLLGWIGLCVGYCAAGAQAEGVSPLMSPKLRVVTEPDFSDSESTHVFEVINQSGQLVKIASIDPSCDCTTATVSATDLPPGGAATIQTHFEFGDREGRQIKKFTVRLAEPINVKPLVLTWEVRIPRVFGKPPILVLWKPGDDRLKKQTRFVMSGLDGLTCVGFPKPGSDLHKAQWPEGLTAELAPTDQENLHDQKRVVYVSRTPALKPGAYKLPLLFAVDGEQFVRYIRVKVLGEKD